MGIQTSEHVGGNIARVNRQKLRHYYQTSVKKYDEFSALINNTVKISLNYFVNNTINQHFFCPVGVL